MSSVEFCNWVLFVPGMDIKYAAWYRPCRIMGLSANGRIDSLCKWIDYPIRCIGHGRIAVWTMVHAMCVPAIVYKQWFGVRVVNAPDIVIVCTNDHRK